MDSTEILPVGGAHLRAELGRTRRIFGKESDDEIIDFHRKETAEFVKPERSLDTFRRLRYLYSNFARNRNNRIGPFWFGIAVI